MRINADELESRIRRKLALASDTGSYSTENLIRAICHALEEIQRDQQRTKTAADFPMLEFRLDPMKGSCIDDIAKQAIAIARATGTSFSFVFNAIRIDVHPEREPRDIVRDYDEGMAKARGERR